MAVIYLHDEPGALRFSPRGDLGADAVEELRRCITTALPTLQGRNVVLDLSLVTSADDSAGRLIESLAAQHARFITATGPMDLLVQAVSGRTPRLVAPPRPAWRQKLRCLFLDCLPQAQLLKVWE